MTPTQPEDRPPPSSGPELAPHLSALRWCLVASFAVMCVGAGWRAMIGGDAVVTYLFINRDWDEEPALAVAEVAGYVLLAAAVAVWWRRCWCVLVAVGVWMGVLALMSSAQRLAGWQLIPGEHAVRIVGPIATAALVAAVGYAVSPGRERLVVRLLRLAAAVTFVFHGWAAWTGQPEFLDLIFLTARELLNAQVEESHAVVLLCAIGVQDVLLAAILLSRLRWLRTWAAAYMAFWGLLTAASRTLHSGWDFAYETLLRVPNGGVPLALFLYWWIDGRRSTLGD